MLAGQPQEGVDLYHGQEFLLAVRVGYRNLDGSNPRDTDDRLCPFGRRRREAYSDRAWSSNASTGSALPLSCSPPSGVTTATSWTSS
jgi:hypothetical protein